MSQTIDLRSKRPAPAEPLAVPKAPPAPPVPPAEEVEHEPETAAEADVLSWHAMMHRIPPKDAAWYVAGVLFVAAAVVAYFRQDALFSVLLMLGAVVLLLRAHSHPSPSHVRLDRTGIAIDGQKYFYHEVGSFWLDYQPPHTKELSLEFKKARHAPLRIPLEEANPLEIRALMIQFIPEKEHERSTLDHVVRRLGL